VPWSLEPLKITRAIEPWALALRLRWRSLPVKGPLILTLAAKPTFITAMWAMMSRSAVRARPLEVATIIPTVARTAPVPISRSLLVTRSR
jgi:hypothetical protein